MANSQSGRLNVEVFTPRLAKLERLAQRLFRHINEELRRQMRIAAGPTMLDFICECRDQRCSAVVRLTVTEFDAIQNLPEDFVVGPDHLIEPPDRVTFSNARFLLVSARPAAA